MTSFAGAFLLYKQCKTVLCIYFFR